MFSNYERLMPEDMFRFECKCCGECCRNVKSSVMLESLDLFKLARHLELETSEVAEKYAEVATVAWGAPIFVMKTKPTNDVCVFLKSGRCEIQEAKPRACRLYPLSACSDDNFDDLVILKTPEKTFHYVGTEHLAGEWLSENMDDESRSYVLTECLLLRKIGKILRRIPRDREDNVNRLMIMYRYILFDTGEDFIPQYTRNMERLRVLLTELIKK